MSEEELPPAWSEAFLPDAIHRVAPEAELFSVRVLGDNMRGRAATFAAGLDWAINNSFQVINTGNSFAAPHIAGIVALILSKHPGLTPFQVKTMLIACATNVQAL